MAMAEYKAHDQERTTMDTPNCEKCRYRYWLAHDCDIHVDMHDCDKYGTDLCKKMNDPDFIKWVEKGTR